MLFYLSFDFSSLGPSSWLCYQWLHPFIFSFVVRKRKELKVLWSLLAICFHVKDGNSKQQQATVQILTKRCLTLIICDDGILIPLQLKKQCRDHSNNTTSGSNCAPRKKTQKIKHAGCVHSHKNQYHWCKDRTVFIRGRYHPRAHSSNCDLFSEASWTHKAQMVYSFPLYSQWCRYPDVCGQAEVNAWRWKCIFLNSDLKSFKSAHRRQFQRLPPGPVCVRAAVVACL